jgi:hypothetical protein
VLEAAEMPPVLSRFTTMMRLVALPEIGQELESAWQGRAVVDQD